MSWPALITARVRVTIDCTECAYPVPVNGIVPSVLCHTCHEEVTLEGEVGWPRIMSYASRESIRTVQGTLSSRDPVPVLDNLLAGVDRIHRRFEHILIEMDRKPLACHECRGALDPDAILGVLRGGGWPHCPGCGAKVIARPGAAVAEHVASHCASVIAVVGETAISGELGETEDKAELVLFSCLGCGASLRINAETPRMLECEYCNETSYMPDALWLRLHPAHRKRAFYLVVEQRHAAEL